MTRLPLSQISHSEVKNYYGLNFEKKIVLSFWEPN